MRRSYVPAVGIGIIAGMRSLAAPALVGRYLKNENESSLGTVGSFLTSGVVSRALQASAAAEMVADKSSLLPDRTRWPSLALRVVAGGVAGSVVAGTAGESRLVGGLLAAGAAVGATFAAFYLRRALKDRLHLSDRLLGAAEDSIAVGAGRRVLATA